VVIDGHLAFLPLDASTLLKGRCHQGSPAQDDGGRGWPSADDTLCCAERPDSTLHTVVELSGGDLKRRNVLLGAAFTTAVFAEPALFALTVPPVADAARDAGTRRIGMTDVEILTDNVAHLRRMGFYTEAELDADLGRALRDSGEPAHATRFMTRMVDSYQSRGLAGLDEEIADFLRRAHDDEAVTT